MRMCKKCIKITIYYCLFGTSVCKTAQIWPLLEGRRYSPGGGGVQPTPSIEKNKLSFFFFKQSYKNRRKWCVWDASTGVCVCFVSVVTKTRQRLLRHQVQGWPGTRDVTEPTVGMERKQNCHYNQIRDYYRRQKKHHKLVILHATCATKRQRADESENIKQKVSHE